MKLFSVKDSAGNVRGHFSSKVEAKKRRDDCAAMFPAVRFWVSRGPDHMRGESK